MTRPRRPAAPARRGAHGAGALLVFYDYVTV